MKPLHVTLVVLFAILCLLLGATIFGGFFLYFTSIASLERNQANTAQAELAAATQGLNKTYEEKEDIAYATRAMLISLPPMNYSQYQKMIERMMDAFFTTNKRSIGVEVSLGLKNENPLGPPEQLNFFYGGHPSTGQVNSSFYWSYPGEPINVRNCPYPHSLGEMGCYNWTLAPPRYHSTNWSVRWRRPTGQIFETTEGARPFWYSGFDLVINTNEFPPLWSFVEVAWIFTYVFYSEWNTILRRMNVSGIVSSYHAGIGCCHFGFHVAGFFRDSTWRVVGVVGRIRCTQGVVLVWRSEWHYLKCWFMLVVWPAGRRCG